MEKRKKIKKQSPKKGFDLRDLILFDDDGLKEIEKLFVKWAGTAFYEIFSNHDNTALFLPFLDKPKGDPLILKLKIMWEDKKPIELFYSITEEVENYLDFYEDEIDDPCHKEKLEPLSKALKELANKIDKKLSAEQIAETLEYSKGKKGEK
jgi:hypothetical protein